MIILRRVFGDRHGLSIFSGCMSNNDSYDCTPSSYDTKGKKYALEKRISKLVTMKYTN